jgi:hypothetical protein
MSIAIDLRITIRVKLRNGIFGIMNANIAIITIMIGNDNAVTTRTVLSIPTYKSNSFHRNFSVVTSKIAKVVHNKVEES